MTTARLINQLEPGAEITTQLEPLNESSIVYLFSIAPILRNYTIDSMKKDDIADVAYRYYQNRHQVNVSIAEAVLPTFNTLMFLYLAIKHQAPLFLLTSLISALPAISKIADIFTSQDSRDACAEWLANRLGQDKLDEIKKFSFTKQGLFSLVDLLKSDGINTSHLEDLAERGDKWSSMWDFLK